MICYSCKKKCKRTGEFPKWWNVYQIYHCSRCKKYFINEISSTTDVEGITSGIGSIYEIDKQISDNIYKSGNIPQVGKRDNWKYVKSEHYNYDC